MPTFPPDRFEWICKEGRGKVHIELLDKRTGRTTIWPDWSAAANGRDAPRPSCKKEESGA